METENNLYIIDRDKIYLQPPARLMGAATRILTEFANREAVRCPNFMPQPEWSSNGPIGLALRKDYCIVWQRLKRLTIKTYYNIVSTASGPYMNPEFASSREYVERTCVWYAPSNMHLYFAVPQLSDGLGSWLTECAMLFAFCEGQTGFWKLPLPNTYVDGKICLGRSWPEGVARTALENYRDAFRRFDENPWNTDLPADQAQTRQLFRFNPLDNSQMAVRGDWHVCCVRFNHPYMAEVRP